VREPNRQDGRSVGARNPSIRVPREAMLFLAVATAYYLGARVGFVLRFPPATTSVLWPPNAILTAALVLATPRRFWLVILAALPAHVLVEAQAGFPAPLIASLFATNCLEAVLAAGAMYRWSDDPTRFDSFQRVLAFVGGAVLLAPTVSSFADAAAVHLLRDEPYRLVFVRRFFSNMLSELALVPSLVLLVRSGPSWLRNTSPRRGAEAALLAIGLVALGAFVFHGYHHGSLVLIGGPFTVLPFLMPLLVLAAVRFGPAGASLSLLTTTLLAISMAISGTMYPTVLTAEERVRALQVFLIMVGVPLLFISALVEERRQAAETLRERLRLEELVSQTSAAFVHLPSHAMPEAFVVWLGRVATFFGLDRAILWQFAGENRTIISVASWARPGAIPVTTSSEATTLPPQIAERLLDGEPFVRMELGVRSLLVLPLLAGEEVLGSLALGPTSEVRRWPAAGVQGARLVADVFASAIARQRAEDALRASETMKSAVLDSLTSRVAVLDREGRIIAVNETWTRSARDGGVASDEACGVGVNYLDVCRAAGEAEPADGPDAAAGIRGVLEGRLPSFGYDYVQARSGSDLWFHLMVVPLNRPEGGAVVSHTDVTERRLAETIAQESRDELAHYLRVSTIGELTTSIAHELNQPLAAILANAQAARRLLARPAADSRREVDEILEEIIQEDRRAGDVIRGLRLLLRKGEPERVELNVNALVSDVTRMIANDVMIRGVTLRRDLAPEPLVTRGDRVQLQQVLLNLLINAVEALADDRGERVIAVRTEERPPATAVVSVTDTGPGLRPGTETEVFKPFYTTKAKGMGMGLSIARSILEAHGGTISADRGANGGATFAFTLPLAVGARRASH
jgi:signal transduction histidine kinase/integral membrane sensor domain MASE1